MIHPLKVKLMEHFKRIELNAKARGDDLRRYPKCAVCKCKIIPSHDTDGQCYYAPKNNHYHCQCGENFAAHKIRGLGMTK